MTDHKSHPVDLHVGGRIRARRRQLGQSQSALGEALGLTFQQVQKYERGVNRVSCSKLFEIAQLQGAPISYYFEGLDDAAGEMEPSPVSQFATLPYAAELAEAFVMIPAESRKAILNVARVLRDVSVSVPPIDVVDHGVAQPFN